MTWVALSKSLAVMLPTLQDQFGASTWLVGWIVAMVDGSVDLAGPIAPILRDKFGIRMVFMASGVVIGTSFISAAFSTSLSTMACILAVVAGPTLGLANILSRDLIGRCFEKYHTTALGIAGCGASMGYIVFAPLTQFLLDLYGWKATMMLLGAIICNLTVCGALLKPRDKTTSGHGDYQAVDKDGDQRAEKDGDQCADEDGDPRADKDGDQKVDKHGDQQVDKYGDQQVNKGGGRRAVDDQEDRECPQSRASNHKTIRKLITSNLHLYLFTSVRYWLVMFVTVMTWLTFAAWVIYFVPYVTISKGYSLHEAANFVLIFGVGKIVGSLLVGQTVPACRKIGIGANVWMLVSTFVLATYFFVDPWLTASWAISVNASVLGCFHSFTFVLYDVITKEAIGVDQLGSALGWIGLKAGIARFAFLFFPGLVFDTLGSYTVAFVIMGGMNVLGGVAMLALISLQ
ncbi:monocarboxylate transporter 14-like [Asterias rubens]|uniref:monocarboxylate transporter 14-like n=1 Tax=Asterias rubens TaxID=7604 RepID=UPI001455A659|nr:monocarboxylate transporter 14-like [Asterias rubens]